MSTVKELMTAMKTASTEKTKGYDTTATVKRIEGNTAWVHIPGGVDETPVRMTINANVDDVVQVRVSGGTAFLVGNGTRPPTDDSTANHAVNIANTVQNDITVLNTVVAENIEATNAKFTTVEADTAKIHNLTADQLTATVGYIGDLNADNISAQDISADHATITSLDVESINATTGYIRDLTSENITADDIIADHATIDTLDSTYATIEELHSDYAEIDLANVNNAWIEYGAMKKAEVFDENVFDLSGDHATLSKIDASKINVANLRADNLVVRRINGQPVVGGYTLIDSNSSGYASKNPQALGWYEFVNAQWVLSTDTTVDMTKAYYQEGNEVSLYDQAYIDGLENDLQQQIDGAVETFTGSVVPTLTNYPYTDWYDTSVTPVHDERAKHVGDIYYVVNSASDENGYCYRFAYDNTSHAYSWVLIKDSDVTKALSDISELQTFESTTTSWMDETDEGLETIRTNYTALSGRVDDVEDTANAALPASTFESFESTTFTDLVDEVDEQSTTMTNMTSRLGLNSDGTGASTDIVAKESALEQTVDGISTRVGKTETKLIGMYATSSTAAGTAAKVATITPALPSGATWELGTGTIITVKFTNANTTSSPTLNVNSKGAKAIKTYANGNLSEAEYKWAAGSTFTFVYNGTNWLMQDSSVSVRMNSNETSISQTADSIISLASGNTTYTKPDGTTVTSAIGTTVNQTANNVLIKATRTGATTAEQQAGGTSAAALINVAPDTVKIAANHVEIDGTATFNAIKSSADAAYDSKGSASAVQTNLDNLEIGGRNLLLSTGTADTWTLSLNSSNYCVHDCYQTCLPVPSLFAVDDLVTISFDWSTTGTSGNFHVECGKVTPYTWGTVVNAVGTRSATSNYVDITSSNTSGHVSVTFKITSSQTSAAETLQWFRIRVDGADMASKTFTISNAKAERGNKATDWTPAPEDVQAEIDAKKSTHTLSSNYSWTYANILTNSEDGHAGYYVVSSTSGVKTGDTVRMKVTVSDMNNTPVYLVGTVTNVETSTALRMTSHGLDTTIIDGGNILTNSIGANQIAANAITADKIAANAVTVGKINPTVYAYDNGGAGAGYAKLFTISHTDQYRNAPISFLFHNRGKKETRVALNFTNTSTATSATVQNATYDGDTPFYYVSKGSAVYDVYFQLAESWDNTYVTDYVNQYSTGLEVVWGGAYYGKSLPTGAVTFTKLAGSRTSAELDNAAKTATTYITHIDNNGIRIHPSSTENNSVVINANGMEVFKGGNSRAQFFDTIRLGASSGQRVTISSSALEMYDSGNTRQIRINASEGVTIGPSTQNHLVISNSATEFYSNNTQYATIASNTNSGLNIHSAQSVWVTGDGGVQINSGTGNILLETNSYNTWIQLASTITANGNISTTGNFIANNGFLWSNANGNTVTIGSQNAGFCHIYNSADVGFAFNNYVCTVNGGSLGTTTYPWGYVITNQTLIKTSAPTAHTTAYTANWYQDGSLYYLSRPTSSSRRYKRDIVKVRDSALDPHKLYDIPVVQFRYTDGYLSADDPYNKTRHNVVGFIAEDIDKHYPIAAIKVGDEVDNWNERYIIPPMLALIQEQHDDIEKLKAEINNLKGAN